MRFSADAGMVCGHAQHRLLLPFQRQCLAESGAVFHRGGLHRGNRQWRHRPIFRRIDRAASEHEVTRQRAAELSVSQIKGVLLAISPGR